MRKKKGDVFAIPLENGVYGFGLNLGNYYVAIYSHIADSPLALPASDFLTIILFDSGFLSSDELVVIGRDLKSPLLKRDYPDFYVRDPFKVDVFHIYEYEPGAMRRASRDECIGLERCASWSHPAVIRRIVKQMSGDDGWREEGEVWTPTVIGKV